jgi:HSP20 family protein
MANRDLTPWSRGGGLTPYGRDPFTGFRREMDRLFDDFFSPAAEGRTFAAPAAAAAAAIHPSVDVDETEQAYTVTAELPGIAEQDIELNLRDNALTISGEKKSERNEEQGGRRYSERSFGRFQRTIPFPAEVDADKVQATCKDGVLTITLPKNEKARDKNRRIEIRREAGLGGARPGSGNGGGQASAESGSGQ